MEAYLGQIILFSNNYTPKDWLPCDGRELLFKEYMALGVVLGKDFPKDAKSGKDLPSGLKFNIPLLESPNSELQYIICVRGIFPQRT